MPRGSGRFTERQIFNSIRYGLRPEDTPDVTDHLDDAGEGKLPGESTLSRAADALAGMALSCPMWSCGR